MFFILAFTGYISINLISKSYEKTVMLSSEQRDNAYLLRTFADSQPELLQVCINNNVVVAFIARYGRVHRGTVEPIEGAQEVSVIPLLRGKHYGLLIRLADEVYRDISCKGQDKEHDKECAQYSHEPL